MKKTKMILLAIICLATFLRIWRLDVVPVSLFGDELDVGYQAYSILKTGRDYSGNFLPIEFQSLAEHRTPLYLYSAIPTVAIFGITPYGVRLPAAIFGILGVWIFYLLIKEMTQDSKLALIAAILLAISPWHIHYSRAGFEITEMIFLYLFGLYLFLKGLKQPRWLFLSVIMLGLTPWVYSTAKLFLPLTVVALIAIYHENLKKISRQVLLGVSLVLILLTGPIIWSTAFGTGSERFEGISIFSDNTIIPSIGFQRFNDLKTRQQDAQLGQKASIPDRLFHNQVTYIGNIFLNNYLTSYSTTFLNVSGETNDPRQSVPGMGVMYKIDFVFLLIGLFTFVKSRVSTKIEKKTKWLIAFLLVATPLPAALTQEGGTHATRLMLTLPGLLFLVSLGLLNTVTLIIKSRKNIAIATLVGVYTISFIFYQHQYWVHYPYDSERWWQAGIGEAVKSVVQLGNQGNQIIISDSNEPMLKFFLGWSMYPPDQFQIKYPLEQVSLLDIGIVGKLDNYYFTKQGQSMSIYDLDSKIPNNFYYLAPFSEIGLDLVKEPLRMPPNLKLVKTITYPTGEPAYYIFSKHIP